MNHSLEQSQQEKKDYATLSNRQLVNELLRDGILYIERPQESLIGLITRRGLHGIEPKIDMQEYVVWGGTLDRLSSILNTRVMNVLNENDKLLDKLIASEHPAAFTLFKRLKDAGWGSFFVAMRRLTYDNPLLALKLFQNPEFVSLAGKDYVKSWLKGTRTRAMEVIGYAKPLMDGKMEGVDKY